jgi:hypothetical protein
MHRSNLPFGGAWGQVLPFSFEIFMILNEKAVNPFIQEEQYRRSDPPLNSTFAVLSLPQSDTPAFDQFD